MMSVLYVVESNFKRDVWHKIAELPLFGLVINIYQPLLTSSSLLLREESATVHAASMLPHHLSGTIYHDISETMTLVVNNSLVIWRQFCLHGPIRQRRLWERLFKRRFINGLTYLLTTFCKDQQAQSVTACALCRPAIIITPVEGTSVHLHCHNSACPHCWYFMYCFSAVLWYLLVQILAFSAFTLLL